MNILPDKSGVPAETKRWICCSIKIAHPGWSSRAHPGEASGAGRVSVLRCNLIVHAMPKTGLREAFEKKHPCLWQIRRHREKSAIQRRASTGASAISSAG
jgi:hypothetical protein